MAYNKWKLILAKSATLPDPDDPPPPPPPPPPDPLEITMQSSFTREQGQPLNITLTARGGRGSYEWNITADDDTASLFSEDDTRIEWAASAQPAGVYALTVAVIDEEGTRQTQAITITVTEVITLNPPGAIADLDVTAINPTTARVSFTAPVSGGAVSGYRYTVGGGAWFPLPVNKRIQLTAGVADQEVVVWAWNDDGDGGSDSDTVTTPEGGLPISTEAAATRVFDETNDDSYTFASVAVGAGAADKVLCITVFVQGTALQAVNLALTGSGVTATRRVTTGTANNHISIWTVPWVSGKPATNNITFDVMASDGTTPVTAIRAAIEVRPLIGREEVPVATGTDTTADGNGELHSTIASIDAEQLVVFAASTTDSSDELLPDLFGLNKENNSEGAGSQSALQYVTATYIPSDDVTSYDVGVEWVNESTGADDGGTLPRHAYCVFAEKTIAPPVGITADWSDNFVEALGIGTHTDDAWSQGPNSFNIWNWPPGLAGAYGVLGSNNNPRAKNLPHIMGQLGIRYFRAAWINGTATAMNNLADDRGQNKRYFEYLYKKKGMRMYGPIGVIPQDGKAGSTPAEIVADTTAAISVYYKPTATPPYIPMLGIEGVNEYNSDENTLPTLAAQAEHAYICQIALYDAIDDTGKLWNGTSGVFCIICSTWKRLLNAYTALAARGTAQTRIWNYGTHGVIHVYNGAREPTLTADGEGGSGASTPQPCEITYHDAQIVNNALPVMITEMGFRYAQPQKTTGSRPSLKGFTMPYIVNNVQFAKSAWQDVGHWPVNYQYNNISWYSAAKYMPRMLLEYYTKGKGTDNVVLDTGYVPTGRPWRIGTSAGSLCIYQLMDDVDTRPDKSWGMCYTNQAENQVIPKPVYYAVARIVDLLKDKTWRDDTYGTTSQQIAQRCTWQGTEPDEDAVNYTITGANSKTGPIIQGQGQPGWLSVKGTGSDRRYYLSLWQREESWRNTAWTQADINALPDIESPDKLPPRYSNGVVDDLDFRKTMTVNFNQTFSTVNIYEPCFGNNTSAAAYGTNGSATDTTLTALPRRTFTNVSSVQVQVPDHPCFIEMIP